MTHDVLQALRHILNVSKLYNCTVLHIKTRPCSGITAPGLAACQHQDNMLGIGGQFPHLANGPAAVEPFPEVALDDGLQLVAPPLIKPAASDPGAQLCHHGVLLLQGSIILRGQWEGNGGQRALLAAVAAWLPEGGGRVGCTTRQGP
jgi:hypothetical protein